MLRVAAAVRRLLGKGSRQARQTTAIELIAAERARQVSQQRYTAAIDERWTEGQLARAAACYALPEQHRPTYGPGGRPLAWPWETYLWRPRPDDRVRELVKAAALIVAEIDRLRQPEQRARSR